MSTWKRFKNERGGDVDINMDNITHMLVDGSYTKIWVIDYENHIGVKETPDEIHMMQPLRSF
jgi:hypothetical protein